MSNIDCPKTNAEISQLIAENVGLVRYAASQFIGSGEEFDDLCQLAQIGFWKACVAYDPKRGSKLTTFCCNCAKTEIIGVLRKRAAKSRSALVISMETGGHLPLQRGDKSMLEQTLEKDKNDLLHEQPADTETAILRKVAFQQAMELIETKMSATYRIVLQGFLMGRTQGETAKILHTTQSTVAKVQKRALSELSLMMRDLGYVDDLATY